MPKKNTIPKQKKKKLRDMPIDKIFDLINSGDLDEEQWDELDDTYGENQRDK